MQDRISIREINADDVVEIRHSVMWPDHPREFVLLEEDNAPNASHYGLFLDDEHIGVISMFANDHDFQFRKFAVLERYQGRGHGSRLLGHILELAHRSGASRLWCNARENALSYYMKFGFSTEDECFTKGGIKFRIISKHF